MSRFIKLTKYIFEIAVMLYGAFASFVMHDMYRSVYRAIIIIIVLLFLTLKNFNMKKLTTTFGFILFSYLSYYAFSQNPGASDADFNLTGVYNSIFYASLFAIPALVCLSIFISLIIKERNMRINKEKNITNTQNENIIITPKKYCLGCGSQAAESNKFCANCGRKLRM